MLTEFSLLLAALYWICGSLHFRNPANVTQDGDTFVKHIGYGSLKPFLLQSFENTKILFLHESSAGEDYDFPPGTC